MDTEVISAVAGAIVLILGAIGGITIRRRRSKEVVDGVEVTTSQTDVTVRHPVRGRIGKEE